MKYFKPKSLTFWAACVPLICGIFIGAEPVHGLTAAAEAVSNMYDGATPGTLINIGLAGIGIRAAV